ncbi:FecR domain-containing protein [Roseibium sp. RKSG952]|uniref:FecR domain-containing protein n=1 Tax=Roseibium sp. RKSG952 TaxID=2529384 RepID=UPI0018AD14BB|nr:FecR domain-containing protein [Roseibium sp. RKSG952]
MRFQFILTVTAMILFNLPPEVAAQENTGCDSRQLADPPRVVYQCGDSLILDAEAAATLQIGNAAAGSRPAAAEITEDGVLVNVDPGSGPFQILTPHAIAAVRGTIYIVDVTGETTAVFVSEGEVAVSRRDGSDPVLLTEGLGVEVTPGVPLDVRRWPVERVTRLLARFGQ